MQGQWLQNHRNELLRCACGLRGLPCKRYNHETLEVRFKGKSIADVLDMTINQAVEFFENVPHILHKIKVLQDVGLGYIKLGQSSTTLSGGESQRVKLATELSKRDTGQTIYILDEPQRDFTSRISGCSWMCCRSWWSEVTR